ncbi:MAG: hypothetical protein KJ745_06475, partial [Gammaproteobacteria bacterium]|nr:hypothetical protein [Gammaproteobacteria bacterium]
MTSRTYTTLWDTTSDTMMLQGEVADDMAAITDFYQRQMEAQGWVDESDAAGADIGMRRLRFTQ